MNGYNNYYGQDPNHNQNVGGSHNTSSQYSYSAQNGWEFVDGAWRPVRQQTASPVIPKPEKKKGSGGKVAGAIALVLACGLSGFGGGYAASTLAQNGGNNGQTVVYKVPENDGANAGATAAGDYSVADIAASAGQSVVSITTENLVADFALGGRIVSGAGSGVIISEDGYIITNHHVVDGARNVSVTLPDGSEHEATVVGSDEMTDIAVLKINVSGLVPAVIGDSGQLAVGEFCIAIGNPMGTLGGTVTDGIISATNRQVNIGGVDMNLLQMSAAVSPGNSGGGLFNSRGELVGIVNAKSSGNDAEGLGFAIPVDTAMQVAGQLIENGYVTGRPALGVTVNTFYTQQEAYEAGVEEPGVYIVQVNPGSAADKAGIRAGDRIVEAAGVTIEQSTDLSTVISELEVGDELDIVVGRNGQNIKIVAVLGESTPMA